MVKNEKSLNEKLRNQQMKNNEVCKKAEKMKQDLSITRDLMEAQQQNLFNRGDFKNFQKCNFCDKTFMNQSFLTSHLQRRHKKEINPSKKTELNNGIRPVADEIIKKISDCTNDTTFLEDVNENIFQTHSVNQKNDAVLVHEPKPYILIPETNERTRAKQKKKCKSLPNLTEFTHKGEDKNNNSYFHRSVMQRKSVMQKMSKRISSFRKKVYGSLQNLKQKSKEEQRIKNNPKTGRTKLVDSVDLAMNQAPNTPDLILIRFVNE